MNESAAMENFSTDCLESTMSLFTGITDEEKERLKENHVCRRIKKNGIIFKEGEKPAGLICLAVGKVKVFKEGVGGREQIVRMAKPVGFIGYRALFADENHTTTAVALEDSSICIFNHDSLYSVLKTNGEFSIRIIKALATELGFTFNRTVTLTQKHIRGRLAEALIFLRDTYGYESDGRTLKIYLSREDIANLSNMTTSNAIRTLTNFAQEKIVELDGRKIKIIETQLLEKVSDQG